MKVLLSERIVVKLSSHATDAPRHSAVEFGVGASDSPSRSLFSGRDARGSLAVHYLSEPIHHHSHPLTPLLSVHHVNFKSIPLLNNFRCEFADRRSPPVYVLCGRQQRSGK